MFSFNYKSILLFFAIFTFYFSVINLFAQDELQIIATVGSQPITVEEFLNRYEFMPHLNYSSDNKDTLKKEFLYSLIAEKLWALEALENGIDTFDVVKNSLKALEKLFVRDELFKLEIESKINITPEELSNGLLNVARTLHLIMITARDSNEIFFQYNKLFTGVDFDSLLKSRAESDTQIRPFKIKLGTLSDETVEKKLFDLKLGDISEPIKSNNYWYIFKLVGEEVDSSLLNDNEISRNKTISILKERKRKKIAENFLNNLLGGKTISANRELFVYFIDSIINILNMRYSQSMIDENKKFELLPADLTKFLKISNPEKLNSMFVEYENINLTLKDFIYYLLYQKINFPTLKPGRIKIIFNKAVRQFIEDELIAQEGYKIGLNNLYTIKQDIQMWRTYYLSELAMQSFANSVTVSDSEIANYLSEINHNTKNAILLNIVEIYNNQFEQMMTVLEELSKGADIKELAKKYNQREYTKKNDGEWGYFLASAAGKIGEIASQMRIGQIYGPVKLDGGYSIFKLIDKKIVTDSLFKMNEEPKDFIKMKVSLVKINKLINEKTVQLAQKYGFQINENLLNNTNVSQINTFTYRLIGFGGKIAALPVTLPIFEWYYLINNNKQMLP